jgi:hypothetical protein
MEIYSYSKGLIEVKGAQQVRDVSQDACRKIREGVVD